MSFGQQLILRFLLEQADTPVNVFEWGSGYSTINFPLWLQNNDREYTWTSIESDPAWHTRVIEMADEAGIENLDARLVDFEGKNAKRGGVPEQIRDKYIDQISDMKTTINVVIVDGRFRRRCTAKARQIQKDSQLGVVCLMDSNKSYRLGSEQSSNTGTLIETGIYPYRYKAKPVSMWLGFNSTEEMTATVNALQQSVDIENAKKRAEQIHKKRNNYFGRARRKASRLVHKVVG
jgi:hypothetical protein